MQLPLPLLKNVVLIGGGHAHALVLRSWAMDPVAGARLTVINPHPSAPYTGMLPGYVAGHYTRDDLEIDLVKLARFAGARLVLGAVNDIDLDAKTIAVPGRPPIPYDICSVNVGITSEMPSLPGFTEHATPAKPLGRFALRWQSYVARKSADHVDAEPTVAIIGGGIGGSELALAMHHRLTTAGRKPVVTVIEQDSILSEVGEKAQVELTRLLDERGIVVRESARATGVTDAGVVLEDGSVVDADFVVGAAGARPYDWVKQTGLATSEGFITIDSTLRSVSHPDVFAAGDCADMAFDPRPKAGVFAVRQAPILTHNIAATLRGLSNPAATTSRPALPLAKHNKLIEFDPQVDYLKLVSLGGKSAGADKYKRFVSGPAMWKLKDKIDRDFMDKLNDLPEMKLAKVPKNAVSGLATALDDHPPLCGGCGAKVGLDVLAGPLGALPESERTDVVRLPGDDAALLKLGSISQVITTDQLRAFTTDPFRMARIATLHAMGDAWAMGASPQAVLVTVTLPQLGRGLQEEWLGEIMAGTSRALEGTGAEIVGGHTSMGAELSLGYTITGIASSPISLAGATAGQRLILTRPIGSGVLFAADMQYRALGTDIAELLAILERPQGDASAALVEGGATAMTDVTGFGLAGHLLGILRESSTPDAPLAAELSLDAVPTFAGAEAASANGIRSHLYESNAAAVPVTQRGKSPRTELLFDPQTAGGMLAAVPAENAEAALAAITALGHQGAIIGTLVPGETEVRLAD